MRRTEEVVVCCSLANEFCSERMDGGGGVQACKFDGDCVENGGRIGGGLIYSGGDLDSQSRQEN